MVMNRLTCSMVASRVYHTGVYRGRTADLAWALTVMGGSIIVGCLQLVAESMDRTADNL